MFPYASKSSSIEEIGSAGQCTPLLSLLKPWIAQAWIIIGTTALWPMKFSFRFLDWLIIDTGMAALLQAI
jgi:hypothetical protein